jgi:hypothetical protein
MRRAGAWSLPECRFLPSRFAKETAACFIVRDASGQALAYVQCEDRVAFADGLSSAHSIPDADIGSISHMIRTSPG